MEPRRCEAFRAKVAAGLGLLVSLDDIAAPEPAPLYRMAGPVAVIDIVGPILKGAPWFIDLLGIEVADTERIRAGLQAAQADDAVKGILLWIDSPGGTVSGVAQVADDVLAIREAGRRFPIVAAVDDLCCSAAYWIAAQAGRIYANESATVGSIGVYAIVDDASRAMENEGIATHVFASGPAKGQGTEYSERPTPAQLDSVRREVDGLADLFVAAVAQGRGMTPGKAREVATGEVWLAGQARGLGLIDGVSPADEVLRVFVDRLS
jgi:signal peptide peptidase SppA